MQEIATWTEPGSPLRIEYACEALEEIRLRVLEGIKALPRTGMGVGGLLLGERAGNRVLLLGSIALPCSYSFGPAFQLTATEKAQSRELLLASPRQVIGWYCSKTRPENGLSEADMELSRELFPAQWQITLALKAGMDSEVSGAFYFHNQSGELAKVDEHRVPEWRPRLVAEAVAGAASSVGETHHYARGGIFDDSVAPVEVARGSDKRTWIITAIAALIVGAIIFEVQNTWLTETSAPASQAQTGEVP